MHYSRRNNNEALSVTVVSRTERWFDLQNFSGQYQELDHVLTRQRNVIAFYAHAYHINHSNIIFSFRRPGSPGLADFAIIIKYTFIQLPRHCVMLIEPAARYGYITPEPYSAVTGRNRVTTYLVVQQPISLNIDAGYTAITSTDLNCLKQARQNSMNQTQCKIE